MMMDNLRGTKLLSKISSDREAVVEEIIDVYGDKKELIGDCLDVLEPFIAEVIPKDSEKQYMRTDLYR